MTSLGTNIVTVFIKKLLSDSLCCGPSRELDWALTIPVLVYCSIVRSIVEYDSPVSAAIPLYLDELIEPVQRKALKIIFGRVDYTEALVLAGLESLSDRRVGACKRFMATARQISPLKNIIPSPAAIDSHYSIRVQLPRRKHGHTRRINDFVTYKFQ